MAVKTMRVAPTAPEAASHTRDFLKEAAVLSRLKHPNVLNFVGMLNAVEVTPPPREPSPLGGDPSSIKTI